MSVTAPPLLDVLPSLVTPKPPRLSATGISPPLLDIFPSAGIQHLQSLPPFARPPLPVSIVALDVAARPPLPVSIVALDVAAASDSSLVLGRLGRQRLVETAPAIMNQN